MMTLVGSHFEAGTRDVKELAGRTRWAAYGPLVSDMTRSGLGDRSPERPDARRSSPEDAFPSIPFSYMRLDVLPQDYSGLERVRSQACAMRKESIGSPAVFPSRNRQAQTRNRRRRIDASPENNLPSLHCRPPSPCPLCRILRNSPKTRTRQRADTCSGTRPRTGYPTGACPDPGTGADTGA